MKIDNCSFPEDLLYDAENFIWINNKEKSVTVGITAIMASIAGRLSSIKLKPVGTKLEKGKSCGTLESAKYFGVVRTPVSGIIVQVNKLFSICRGLVCQDRTFRYGRSESS